MAVEYERWRLREVLRDATRQTAAEDRHAAAGTGERQPKKATDQSRRSFEGLGTWDPTKTWEED